MKSIAESNIKPKEDFWRPAEQGKINFDDGFVMGSCTYPLGRARDSITAEAKACLEAIVFGEEMGFLDLVVEDGRGTIGSRAHHCQRSKKGFGMLKELCYHSESGDGVFKEKWYIFSPMNSGFG
ncbi:hypothetical protein Gohar_008918, partial [Gossypium harknessii]|nr:hypothetical protein [Gossypium harknessii]